MPKSSYNQRYRRFCFLLEQARKRAGVTQTELANRLGRPQSYVSKYENGERRIDLVEFLEIADELEINIPALLQDLVQVEAE